MWFSDRFFVQGSFLTTLDVVIDQAGTGSVADGSIHTQVVVVRITPHLAGDGAIVGGTGSVGTAHMFFGLFSGVSVAFHNVLYIR